MMREWRAGIEEAKKVYVDHTKSWRHDERVFAKASSFAWSLKKKKEESLENAISFVAIASFPRCIFHQDFQA